MSAKLVPRAQRAVEPLYPCLLPVSVSQQFVLCKGQRLVFMRGFVYYKQKQVLC